MTIVTIGIRERHSSRKPIPLRVGVVTSSRCYGFTYIGVLIAIALMGIALAGAGVAHHRQAQRAKEAELLFIGDQFLRAITDYYEKSQGGAHRFPQKLDDLLHDTRYAVPVRHLRRVYRDPMTGGTEWGLVEGPDRGITGIYSLSQRAPVKVAGFPERFAQFEGAGSYGDWKFIYQPAAGGTQESVGSQARVNPLPSLPAADRNSR